MAFGTVIFVPGLFGSALGYPGVTAFDRALWLNPVRLALGGFHDLILPVAGDVPPSGSSVELRPGLALPAVYGLMTTYLWGRGWNVVEVPQDWRKSYILDAVAVANKVRELDEGGATKILCHSRGGLVARRALQLLASTNQAALVHRVVAMGVPMRGSMLAVQALACYHSLKRRIAGMGSHLPFGLASRVGTDATDAAIRSWPAIAELLPDPDRSWLPPESADRLYWPETWSAARVPPVPAYLATAKINWSILDDPSPLVDWIDVVGTGIQTPRDLPPWDRITEPGTIGTVAAGDGVVLVESAHQAGRRVLYTPTGHDVMSVDGRLWPWLHSLLLDGLAEDVTLPGGIFSL